MIQMNGLYILSSIIIFDPNEKIKIKREVIKKVEKENNIEMFFKPKFFSLKTNLIKLLSIKFDPIYQILE